MNTTDRAGNPPVAMCTDMLTWIAVEAMKGIIGSYGFDLLPDNQIAQRSFEVATAMLHERTLRIAKRHLSQTAVNQNTPTKV